MRLLGNDIVFPVDDRCRCAASSVYGAGRMGRYADPGVFKEVDDSDLEWLGYMGDDKIDIGVQGNSVDVLDAQRGVVDGVMKYGVPWHSLEKIELGALDDTESRLEYASCMSAAGWRYGVLYTSGMPFIASWHEIEFW
jgi:hypothetical protein